MKLLGIAVAILLVLFLSLALFPLFASLANKTRVTATSEGLSCITAAGETSCNLNLTDAHMHFDTTEMTVTETSPGSGDRTAGTVVRISDRQQIAVSGLSGGTSYNFTVAYLKQATDVSDMMADVLNLAPVFFLFGPLALIVIAFGWAMLTVDMPWALRIGLGVVLVIGAVYFLPGMNAWVARITGASSISDFSGLKAAVRLFPFIALLLVAGLGVAIVIGLRRKPT